ncbi:hypothetical protein V6Z12_D11G153500 [Gossypium hirsutum]
MNCFSCFSSEKKAAKRQNSSTKNNQACDNATTEAFLPQQHPPENIPKPKTTATEPAKTTADGTKDNGNNNIAVETFTFRELAAATRNFRKECLIGEGGFGRVYKGKLEKTGQVMHSSSMPFIEISLVFFFWSHWVYFILGSSRKAA